MAGNYQQNNNPRLRAQGQRPQDSFSRQRGTNVRGGYGQQPPSNVRSVKPLDTTYSQRSYRSYAEQRRAHQPGADRTRVSAGNPDTARYRNPQRYTEKKPKKPISKFSIIATAIVVAAIGVGLWFIFNPLTFEVTVNGVTRQVNNGATIDTLIEEGYATPTAGNLLAVNGTVLQKGKGNAFVAIVNDEETTDGSYKLKPDAVITIKNGTDLTESATTTTTTIEPENTITGYGAIHAYLEGQAGETVTKTGDISGITVEEVVSKPVNGGMINYNAKVGDEKVVALTFDDGPWPESTQQILDILKTNNAKATFFTIGNQIANNSAIVKRAADEGHQICTHSWDHAEGSGQGVNMTYMTSEEQVQEVKKGLEAIANATGSAASTVFRSPGGNFSGQMVWTLKPYISAEINWNIDTEDWRRPGAEVIAARILQAQPGDVILMHDGGGNRSQTVAALKTALPQLAAKGYKFVTIDELMALSTPQTAAEAAASSTS